MPENDPHSESIDVEDLVVEDLDDDFEPEIEEVEEDVVEAAVAEVDVEEAEGVEEVEEAEEESDEEALEELEAEELELLDDEMSESLLVDEAAELRAIRREELSLNVEVQGVAPGEFVCQSCFLVKRKSQLADPVRMICRDCAT